MGSRIQEDLGVCLAEQLKISTFGCVGLFVDPMRENVSIQVFLLVGVPTYLSTSYNSFIYSLLTKSRPKLAQFREKVTISDR